MKKYYLSHIDFTEIVNVTANEEQLEEAQARIQELGLLTEKRKPSVRPISKTANSELGPFYLKLRKRMRHRGGVSAINATLHMLYDRKDYYGFFLYLAFLYGFLEWQLPEKLTLLPASPEALKCYCGEFIYAIDNYLPGGPEKDGGHSVDDEDQENL